MCSFYLDLNRSRSRSHSQVPYSHGVRFEPEVPLGNLRALYQHPQRTLRRPSRNFEAIFTRLLLALFSYQTSIGRLRAKRSKPAVNSSKFSSGGYRDRTGDIQLAKLALSQLS